MSDRRMTTPTAERDQPRSMCNRWKRSWPMWAQTMSAARSWARPGRRPPILAKWATKARAPGRALPVDLLEEGGGLRVGSDTGKRTDPGCWNQPPCLRRSLEPARPELAPPWLEMSLRVFVVCWGSG